MMLSKLSVFWEGIDMKRRLSVALAMIATAAASLAGMQSVSASNTVYCSGGSLSGAYPGDVVVTGSCRVDEAPVVIHGDLRVAANGEIDADFAFNKLTDHKPTNLTVHGSVYVGTRAIAMIGCVIGCPDGTDEGSASHAVLWGDVRATGAMLVEIVNSEVHGDYVQRGGGKAAYGVCSHPFTQDTVIAGDTFDQNLDIENVNTCDLYTTGNLVHGNMTFSSNATYDFPFVNNDLHSNTVHGDLACVDNAEQPGFDYWGYGRPNVVYQRASGQCSFDTILLEPGNPSYGTPTPLVVHHH